MPRDKPVSAEARRVADIVRAVYIRERRSRETVITGLVSNYNSHKKWDGGEHRGKRLPSTWVKIAEFALANDYDPAALVEAQFRGTGKHCPEPFQLCSPAAVDRYLRHNQSVVAEMPWDFQHQKLVCHAELTARFAGTNWTRSEILANVLYDETLDMSALFRYCFAVQAKEPQIADTYKREAIIQYMRRPDEYDKVWAQLIPEGFHSYAEGQYLNLVSQAEENN